MLVLKCSLWDHNAHVAAGVCESEVCVHQSVWVRVLPACWEPAVVPNKEIT